MKSLVLKTFSLTIFCLMTMLPAVHADNYKGSKAYVCPQSGQVFHSDKKCSVLKGCSAAPVETTAKMARKQGYTLCETCSQAIADAKAKAKAEKKEKKAKKAQQKKEKKAKKADEKKKKAEKKQKEKAEKAQMRVEKAQRALEKAQKAQQKL